MRAASASGALRPFGPDAFSRTGFFMRSTVRLLGILAVVAAPVGANAAQADPASNQPVINEPIIDEPMIDEIVVIGDPLELLDLRASRTVSGLNLDYAEIPRSISAISDETIARFNIETVDDLAAITPGAFTGSFFGVPGSVTLRGNRADNYFRGFKRVENPGTFPTPIGSSERIEVVRGPTPAQYGAGRVGGFINVTPLTALTERQIGDRGHLFEIGGAVGSYGKKIAHASAGGQFDLSGLEAGLFGYAEFEDSKSFYRGIEPQRKLAQGAFTLKDDDRYSLEIGAFYYDSDGYLQTPGWNRITQELIDDGVYITGADSDLADLNGDGKLTPDEVDAAVGSTFGASNIRQFIDFGLYPGAAFGLDGTIGATRLDPRTVYISKKDIASSQTFTAYSDLSINAGGNKTVRLQAFFDTLDGDLYQSYGFAAQYKSDAVELRASLEAPFQIGSIPVETITGVSWRRYDNHTRQTFLSGYLAIDRRDLSIGATGGDIFDDPFSLEPGGIGWDTDLDSTTSDLGFFSTALIRPTERLDLTASLRLDRFSARSINTGAMIFNPALGFAEFSGDDFKASYELSARYDFGPFSAYAVYAENNTLETNDAGGVEVDRIAQNNFVGDSELIEVGLKASTDRILATLSAYRQERQRSDPFGNLDRETSKGIEAEIKYLFSDRWSLTSAATLQETMVGAPGPCGSGNGEFVVLPPSYSGILPEDGYGGLFAALNASCIPELQNGYKRRTTPDAMASAFLTYTSPETAAGVFGATGGAYYVSETGGKIRDAIRLPDYAIAKASVFWRRDALSVTAHVDNLFDKRYFIPAQNVYEEVAALPGRGREFTITMKAAF